MMTPFEEKTRLGSVLDRMLLRVLLLVLCCLWFYQLWGQMIPSLAAGGALGIMLWLLLRLWDQKALRSRGASMRKRIGGLLWQDAVLLCPTEEALARVMDCLSPVFGLEPLCQNGAATASYKGEALRFTFVQKHPSESLSLSDVLDAQRGLTGTSAARAVLVSFAKIPRDVQTLAESLEPPLRLIGGDTLLSAAGALAPADDQQLVRVGARMRKPFGWKALRPLILAPQKSARYALYGVGLMVVYIWTGHFYYLLPGLLCILLSSFSFQQKRKPQRL